MAKIRLAAVSYLNTRPLIDPFQQGFRSDRYEVRVDLPSRLPALLETGEADLALAPAAYCARHPDLSLARGSGIACRGAVRSILLLVRNSIAAARRIAVTTASMSSAALLEILLERHFGSKAETCPADDPLEDLRAGEADGALLIGDPALQADSSGWNTYDLGEEWLKFTGLPFVFALWAGKDAQLVEAVAPDLEAAMRMGRAEIPRIARESAAVLGLSSQLCEEYLQRYIIHHVGAEEMLGYECFRTMLSARERQ